MTHSYRFSSLLSAFAFLAAIPFAVAGAQNAAEKQIQTLLANYETSLNAGDAGRIEQLYTVDGVFMPAGFPTASSVARGDLPTALPELADRRMAAVLPRATLASPPNRAAPFAGPVPESGPTRCPLRKRPR